MYDRWLRSLPHCRRDLSYYRHRRINVSPRLPFHSVPFHSVPRSLPHCSPDLSYYRHRHIHVLPSHSIPILQDALWNGKSPDRRVAQIWRGVTGQGGAVTSDSSHGGIRGGARAEPSWDGGSWGRGGLGRFFQGLMVFVGEQSGHGFTAGCCGALPSRKDVFVFCFLFFRECGLRYKCRVLLTGD